MVDELDKPKTNELLNRVMQAELDGPAPDSMADVLQASLAHELGDGGGVPEQAWSSGTTSFASSRPCPRPATTE